MWTWPRLVVPVSLVLCITASWAEKRTAAQECAALLKGPQVSVAATTLNPVVKYDLDMQELSQLTVGHTGANTLGNTTFKVSIRTSSIPQELITSAGAYCARRGLSIEVLVEDFTVHIARELRNSTCLREEVRQHEQAHVEINRALLATLLPRLRSEAAVWATDAVYTGNATAVREWLVKQPPPDFQAIASRHLEAGRQVHGDMDSAGEYRRLSTVCTGEAAKLYLMNRNQRSPVH